VAVTEGGEKDLAGIEASLQELDKLLQNASKKRDAFVLYFGGERADCPVPEAPAQSQCGASCETSDEIKATVFFKDLAKTTDETELEIKCQKLKSDFLNCAIKKSQKKTAKVKCSIDCAAQSPKPLLFLEMGLLQSQYRLRGMKKRTLQFQSSKAIAPNLDPTGSGHAAVMSDTEWLDLAGKLRTFFYSPKNKPELAEPSETQNIERYEKGKQAMKIRRFLTYDDPVDPKTAKGLWKKLDEKEKEKAFHALRSYVVVKNQTNPFRGGGSSMAGPKGPPKTTSPVLEQVRGAQCPVLPIVQCPKEVLGEKKDGPSPQEKCIVYALKKFTTEWAKTVAKIKKKRRM